MKTKFTSPFPRAAIMLLLMMLTTTTAWAEKCQECGASAYTTTNTATCTQGGCYQYECDDCHCVWLGEATPALGHSVENNVCTRCGKYGYCGDYGHESEVTWEVTGDAPAYTLTISGTGAMKNYSSSNQPWAAFKDVITTANIGDGVTRIGGNAFYQLTALTSVTIAPSVTNIANAVFFECTKLTTVSGASGVTYVDSSAFYETAWENNLPDGLTSVGHVAYRFVGDGTSVNLDAATTQICDNCFQYSKITSIVIPASVERIGDYAFAHSALQKMYVLRHESSFPEITQLGNDAFEICFHLTIVVPAAAYDNYDGLWFSGQGSSILKRGYTVTCGTAGITATSYAPIVAEGETVTLSGTGTIPDGYAFAGYSVTKDGTNPAETVTVTEASGVYSFTMPASNVTVNAKWTPIPWAGSGDSADDPYIIEYPSQLDLLATNVNNGESYSGKYFVLANDITYTHTTDWNANSEENNYTAIGGVFNSSIHPFNGTFDGKGHTVSGIRIYKWGETDAESYQGLFGYVGNNGTVKNVTVADACISGYEEVGGVVGQIEYGGKVENCHATATVALHAVMTETSGFGGIAGITYNATISGCSSAVTLTSKNGCYYFGAIVGCANMGTLRNNLAIGTAIPALKYNTNYEASGAIVGHNGEATLEHNYYSGCTVGDATRGIGSGYHITGSNDRHDVTDNDGAVPAIILSETQTSMPTLTNGDKVVFRREFKENVASTVCLPFSIDADQAAAAGKFYTFVGVDKTDPDNWEVIMQEADPTADPPVAGNKASALTANTPYLFKPAATGPVLFHGTAPASVSAGNTIKEDWTFQGTYENLTWDDGQTVLYGLAGNAFTPTSGGTYEIGSFQRFNSGTTAAFRAYMYYGDTAPAHHAAPILPESMKVCLIAADGSTTEVKEVREVLTPEGMSVARNKDNIWYTLDGRKLNAQPTQKGLYIVNGKKVATQR